MRSNGLKYRQEMVRRTTNFRKIAFGRTKNNLSDVLQDLVNQCDEAWLVDETGLHLSTIRRVGINPDTPEGETYSPRASTIEAICRATKTKLELS